MLNEAEEIFLDELGHDWPIPLSFVLCPVGFGLAFFVEKVIFLRDPEVCEAVSEKEPFAVPEVCFNQNKKDF